MGLILRTHIDTFKFLLRKLNIKNYEGLMNVSQKEIEEAEDSEKTEGGIYTFIDWIKKTSVKPAFNSGV